MARLTKELRDRAVRLLDLDLAIHPHYAATRDIRESLAACSVDYLDLANHPTTTELEDGRVQITLTAEEWRAVREASRWHESRSTKFA